MARESKKTRDEKRFGKPERFADWLMENPIYRVVDGENPETIYLKKDNSGLHGIIASSAVVDIQNVFDYTQGFDDKKRWFTGRDYPYCVPSMGSMFMEYSCFGVRTGALIGMMAPTGESIRFAVVMIRSGAVPGGKAVIEAVTQYTVDLRSGEATQGSLNLARSLVGADSYGPLDTNRYRDSVESGLVPAMLALSFMNCKNTTVQPHESDRKLNRVRSAAGLKPFVRYHTINIEPMRKVLRTEGGIETNGLKKALHICRGHFARYSEDKPLFGHTSGLVWRPAHTRGSMGQGVVVSDYKVNAPKEAI